MQKCMFPDNHGDILGHVRNPAVLVEQGLKLFKPQRLELKMSIMT